MLSEHGSRTIHSMVFFFFVGFLRFVLIAFNYYFVTASKRNAVEASMYIMELYNPLSCNERSMRSTNLLHRKSIQKHFTKEHMFLSRILCEDAGA